MMNDFFEVFSVVGTCILCVLLLFAGVFLIADQVAGWNCSRYEAITGAETHYAHLDGCYIRHEGEMVRYSAYEQMIIARDGLAK